MPAFLDVAANQRRDTLCESRLCAIGRNFLLHKKTANQLIGSFLLGWAVIKQLAVRRGIEPLFSP